MITYTNPSNTEHIRQILKLQSRNLSKHIAKEEAEEQGFVTVEHTEELLWKMNEVRPHIIAMDGDEVVGYALVMTTIFKNSIPILIPMFEMIDTLTFRGRPLSAYQYFIMGQVCIDKNYRGQGIFKGMFQKMKAQCETDFDIVITEISNRNKRSLRAHEKVGFRHLYQYQAESENWILVTWDWK